MIGLTFDNVTPGRADGDWPREMYISVVVGTCQFTCKFV